MEKGCSVSGQLGEVIGAVCDTAGVARRLRITEDDVQDRVCTHQLLGCITSDRVLVFPGFQFAEDGSPLPGLNEVLSMMAQGTADRWQVALWMCTSSEQLQGRRPHEALRRGDVGAVRQLAQQAAARWRY
jgi:hypothetical protein